MKKKNSSSQQIMTLVIVVSLLVVVLFYVFVYKDLVSKAQSLKNTNRELSEKVAVLKEYYEKQGEYKALIEEYKSDIRKAVSYFPELVLEEDAMMQAYNSADKAEKLAYTSIALPDTEVIYTVPAEQLIAVKFSDDESDRLNSEQAMLFMKKDITYVSSCDYVSLKSMIKDITDRSGRTVIKNILFEKNKELNCLEGSTEVSFYYIPTFGYEYEPVAMKDYIKGMDSLFVLKEEVDEEDKDNN